MSADNAILIAEIPLKMGGKEYRVVHACGPDNMMDSDDVPTNIVDCYRVLYFQRACVQTFSDPKEATAYAVEYAKEFSVLEYGVMPIILDRPLLDISREEANSIIDHYYGWTE